LPQALAQDDVEIPSDLLNVSSRASARTSMRDFGTLNLRLLQLELATRYLYMKVLLEKAGQVSSRFWLLIGGGSRAYPIGYQKSQGIAIPP